MRDPVAYGPSGYADTLILVKAGEIRQLVDETAAIAAISTLGELRVLVPTLELVFTFSELDEYEGEPDDTPWTAEGEAWPPMAVLQTGDAGR